MSNFIKIKQRHYNQSESSMYGSIKEKHFKVGITHSEKFTFIYFNESPLKMMKNTFI